MGRHKVWMKQGMVKWMFVIPGEAGTRGLQVEVLPKQLCSTLSQNEKYKELKCNSVAQHLRI